MSEEALNQVMGRMPTIVRLTFAKCEMAEPEEQRDTGGVILSIDEPEPKEVVVVLQVSKPGWGFGDFTIIQTRRGCFVNTECSGIEMVKEAFAALIDSAITDHDDDPVKHALFNDETGRRCGPRCSACAGLVLDAATKDQET